MDYEYTVVSNNYRKHIIRDFPKRNFQIGDQQVVKDLMAGKTLLIDAKVPYTEASRPFRRLYNHFNSRGYRLRIHLFDDIDLNIYRGVIVWAESIFHLYTCNRCKQMEIVAGTTRPHIQGCLKAQSGNHFWRERKKV